MSSQHTAASYQGQSYLTQRQIQTEHHPVCLEIEVSKTNGRAYRLKEPAFTGLGIQGNQRAYRYVDLFGNSNSVTITNKTSLQNLS
jgi:hypothetical protein